MILSVIVLRFDKPLYGVSHEDSMNLKFFSVKDSRGRESRTLLFVAVAFTLISLRFMLGGLDLTWGAVHYVLAGSALLDYGAAVTAVLAIWLGREWIFKGESKPPLTKGTPDV
jgi:hypothetical protein